MNKQKTDPQGLEETGPYVLKKYQGSRKRTGIKYL